MTYTNRTDAPVTVELALDVTNPDGAAAPAEMLAVEPATLTVQPGDTASATVTVDVSAGGEFGVYGGYLIAEAGGAVATRTPVGFHKESEHYDLTVQGITRDGRPALGAASTFNVVDVTDTEAFRSTQNTFVNGSRTLRVPVGTYTVMGRLSTVDGSRSYAQSRTLAGDPEVEVTQDTTVVLDARKAVPLEIETPLHPDAVQAGNTGFAVYREGAENGDWQMSVTFNGLPIYALPTEPVTLGSFEAWTRTRTVVAPIAMTVVDPTEQRLNLHLMRRSPLRDIDREVPVVWVGAGDPEDYEGLDVAGAAVLTQRGLGSFPSNKIPTAHEHGAVALIEMNNASGFHTGFAGNDAPIPGATISQEDGNLLRDLLAEGEVTAHLRQEPQSPFLYDLVHVEPDRIPEQLHYVADVDELATVPYRYHSSVPGQIMNEARHFYRPWTAISTAIVDPIPMPHERTEYLVAHHTLYKQVLWAELPFRGRLGEPHQLYQPGEQREVKSFFRSPLAPGVLPDIEFEGVDLGQPTYREGDTLAVRTREWRDPSGNSYIADPAADDSELRVYENGQLIDRGSRGFGDFSVGSGPATHRLELDMARDADWWTTSVATRTAWTLQSPGTTTGRVPVPLLLASYHVSGLDLTNTAPRNGLRVVRLDIRHQPGVDGPPLAEVQAWISYDDGDSWQEQRVRMLPNGEALAFVASPDDPAAEFASLRIAATDRDGNAIEQEVIRAWRLAPTS